MSDRYRKQRRAKEAWAWSKEVVARICEKPVAIEAAFKELREMPREEFLAELEKHKDSDVAKLLRYAFDPEWKEDEQTNPR